MALQRSSTVIEVAADAARWIRSLTGFDRVMVYRFDAEWNGEVIAEDRRADLNAFLGLHYPATDIPAQARELYRRNWLRLIPDIQYAPVPLVPRCRLRQRGAAGPQHVDAAQRLADPHRVPRQHGRQRVDVGLDRDPGRALGPRRLPPLQRSAPSRRRGPQRGRVPRPADLPAHRRDGGRRHPGPHGRPRRDRRPGRRAAPGAERPRRGRRPARARGRRPRRRRGHRRRRDHRGRVDPPGTRARRRRGAPPDPRLADGRRDPAHRPGRRRGGRRPRPAGCWPTR